jgi:chemotaxis protein MotB
MAERHSPVIIKKIKKVAGGGHSSGAWKVAYADFVTAMMAFFLLLWLLNSVTQEQLEGISNYFAPASVSATKSGSGAVLGGAAVSAPIGSLTQASEQSQSMVVELPPPTQAPPGQPSPPQQAQMTPQQISEQQAKDALKKQEEAQFQEAVKELNNAIAQADNKELAKSLIVENTTEGMRIQVVDQDGLAMFPSGSAQPYDHTVKALKLVADVVKKMPQQISITGHTDAKRFGSGEAAYSNWELSADRANASRRTLTQLGVPTERVVKVVGEADKDPLLTSDPENARNRRIAIVLLRGTGEQQAPKPADANASPVPPPSATRPSATGTSTGASPTVTVPLVPVPGQAGKGNVFQLP